MLCGHETRYASIYISSMDYAYMFQVTVKLSDGCLSTSRGPYKQSVVGERWLFLKGYYMSR